MAKEAAEAFVKRYGSDEAFRNKVNGFDGPQAIRTFLDQEGFGQFTREEFEDVRKAATDSGELSDAELEAVAGGEWGISWQVTCEHSYCAMIATDPCSTTASGYTCTSVW